MYRPTDEETELYLKLTELASFNADSILSPSRFHEYLNEKYKILKNLYEMGDRDRYNEVVQLLDETYLKYINDQYKVFLPIIRKTMPKQIAQHIIGVQPMTGPTGQVFKMKARYGWGNNNES